MWHSLTRWLPRKRRSASRPRRPRSCRLEVEELESRLAPSVTPAFGVNVPITTDPGVQQMPSVAVDPLDPQHLVIAYMDRSLVQSGYAGIGVAVSNDGGESWEHNAIPLPANFDQGAAHPIVHFDGQGHVLVGFMAATFLGTKPALTNPDYANPDGSSDRVFGFQANNGVFVARSDDGGLSWNQPAAVVSHLYDGEHPVSFEIEPDLAVDTFRNLPNGQPNPNYGNLYVVWSRIYVPGQFPGHPEIDGGIDIMLAVSRDGGLSWQTRLQEQNGVAVTVIQDPTNTVGLPGLGLVDQARITIGPEGDIYVLPNGGVQHSTDAGVSFDGPDYTTGRRVVFTGDTAVVNQSGLPSNHFRTFPPPNLAADPTRPGYLYAASATPTTDALGNQIDAADVIFRRSTDYGVTWLTMFQVGSTPNATVLNDDNGGLSATGQNPNEVISGQAMPRLAVDAHGNLSLIWYDTRHDPANHLLDVWGTTSTDAGLSFSPNYRVTDQSFDADAGRFTDAIGKTDYYLGDFQGLALANNTAYAAWTDTRNGNQDIFFARDPIAPVPAAPNDRYEPNNTAAMATDLGTVIQKTVPRLAIPTGDEDWFKVTATATGDLTASALQSAPGQQLRLGLFDASGQTLLASGTDILDSGGHVTGQIVSFPGQSGTSYLVRVLPVGGTGSGTYSLQLKSLTANLGTIVHNVSQGLFAGGGQAYYLLGVAAGGALQVQLTASATLQGQLSLELLDPDKLTVLATGTASGPSGPGQVEQASVAVTPGQTILVQVSDTAGTQGNYTLEFTNLDQLTTPENASLLVPAGAGPSSVAVGDLNGDGIPDLVVADALSNTVSVLLGNGDGTFQAPRQFAVGAFQTPNPLGAEFKLPTFRRKVVLADLTHNGKLDIVVTNYDSGDVSVLLNRGDGTFEPQRRFDATTAPFDVAVGDLTGNGIPDLVVASADLSGMSTVAVLLGRGDGTFQPERTFMVPTPGDVAFSSVAIADLNHDGKADLVFSGSPSFQLTVFLGNGDGTFQPGTDFPSNRLGTGVVIGDVNGDGNLDITTSGLDPGSLSVLLGNGDGTFSPLVNPNTGSPGFLAGQNPVAVTFADVGSAMTQPDGSMILGPPDGQPDLIVAASGGTLALPALGPPGLFVLPGMVDAQGQFTGFGLPLLLAPAEKPLDVTTADLTGDGVRDVIAVTEQGVLVIFGKRPPIVPNDTPRTARNLGTVVHLVEPALTIVPDHQDNYYTLTVPTEAARGAGDEVLDCSGLFQYTEGAGLSMEVRDAQGHLLGSGERFRVQAPQGAVLTLHVFGVMGAGGQRGAGAYTLDIDVLPQLVSVESQPLLPGPGLNPGGPTTSLVLTFQGDRIDPATAEDPTHYRVTWLGPDGIAGTADDQTIAVRGALYDPSTNVSVASGNVYPTAIRQTVTLLFTDPLPAGSYQVDLAPAIQTAAFNEDEPGLITPSPGVTGHPVVSLNGGQVTEGARRTALDLVFAAGALGDLGIFQTGTPFLTQLHDDLGALLDAQLSQLGDSPTIPGTIDTQIVDRFDPALGPVSQRPLAVLVIWLDVVSPNVADSQGRRVVFNTQDNAVENTFGQGYVNVTGNLEVIVLPFFARTTETLRLSVSNVPATARGGVLYFGAEHNEVVPLTAALRSGTLDYLLSFGATPTATSSAAGPPAELGQSAPGTVTAHSSATAPAVDSSQAASMVVGTRTETPAGTTSASASGNATPAVAGSSSSPVLAAGPTGPHALATNSGSGGPPPPESADGSMDRVVQQLAEMERTSPELARSIRRWFRALGVELPGTNVRSVPMRPLTQEPPIQPPPEEEELESSQETSAELPEERLSEAEASAVGLSVWVVGLSASEPIHQRRRKERPQTPAALRGR
jgi:hypothetical protein